MAPVHDAGSTSAGKARAVDQETGRGGRRRRMNTPSHMLVTTMLPLAT
jgi:hypothetical protein